MALMRWDPFAELNALQDQLNNLFSDTYSSQRTTQFSPVTDVYSENDKSMVIEVQLPSFTDEEINVDVHDHALEIKAKHDEKEEDKKQRNYLVRESSTSFYRRIALPKQADEDNVAAHFEHGVLKVTVPFKELPKPKKIAIGKGSKTEKPNKK